MISQERYLSVKELPIKNADNDEAYHLVMNAARTPTLEVHCSINDAITGNEISTYTRVPALDLEHEMMEGLADMITTISDHSSEVDTYTTILRRKLSGATDIYNNLD
jgi:hypothetical protein